MFPRNNIHIIRSLIAEYIKNPDIKPCSLLQTCLGPRVDKSIARSKCQINKPEVPLGFIFVLLVPNTGTEEESYYILKA